MNHKFGIRMIAILSTLLITLSAMGFVTAFAQEDSLLEYSVFYPTSEIRAQRIVSNPNDIVTPYVEDLFNIRIKDFSLSGPSEDAGIKEAFAMFRAANNMPDVIATNNMNAAWLATTGQFADLTELIPQYMPDYMKYIKEDVWSRWMTDGRNYILPAIFCDLSDEQFADNPYLYSNISHTMCVREDILAQCGYSFTPIAQIAAEYTDKGLVPPLEALEITPAIDTPEKWVEFLEKVQALNLKVGDKDVVPLDVPSWAVFHISTMYDCGHWRMNGDGEVDGYLGLPASKDFYKLWSNLYQTGLLDQDYLTDKNDQYQQKIASGQVACTWTIAIPDFASAQQALLDSNPDAYLRPVIMPKQDQAYGFFDIFQNGFDGFLINKDFPDIPRLLSYFNWFYTDEGMDICTWGPESAGLWEILDGVKMWKEDVAPDILENNTEGKNVDYYGLYNPNVTFYNYESKAGLGAPTCTITTTDWRLHYPIKLNAFDMMSKVFYKNYNMGLDLNGVASYGDSSDSVAAVSSYYWNKFSTVEIAKLLQAETDEAYDTAWTEIYNSFVKETDYANAKENMIAWFAAHSK